MSHVALVRLAERIVADSLASLIQQQIIRRGEVLLSVALEDCKRPSRAKEWQALATGLWRMASDEMTGEAAVDHLSWTYAGAPIISRELVPT